MSIVPAELGFSNTNIITADAGNVFAWGEKNE